MFKSIKIMGKVVLYLLMVILTCVTIYAQQFEPKWVGEVKILSIDQDTISYPAEKANIQIKTTQSAGKILFDIGNIRQKCVIKGSKSTAQCDINKPVILVVKCKQNDIDPTSFIQIVKFEENRKERKTELAMENWLGNVSEMNYTLMPFEADQYGKSSYILKMEPKEGEYGVRVLNPETLDSRVPIFYCFGIHSNDIPTQVMYEYEGILYPLYKDSEGNSYIRISKKDKIIINPEDLRNS